MKHVLLLLLCLAGCAFCSKAQPGGRAITGSVLDAASREAIINAAVSVPGGAYGTVTNAYGVFTLQVPGSDGVVIVRASGYRPDTLKMQNAQAGEILLQRLPNGLREVLVKASAGRLQQHIQSTQMGKTDLPLAMLVKAPAIGGEPDIIKALQLTPGVKRGTEGSIGFFVRGGNTDENLILLDEATVYNAGHLLGFFSVFNNSALKDVQLYKSAFPAQYAGRLSSVLDVRMRDGDKQQFRAAGSLGLISSNLTVEGPLLKNKASIIVSGRRTYIDKIFPIVPYHFYDVNGKVNATLSARDRIYLSAYKGDDVLHTSGKDEDSSLDLKSGMKLGNATGSFRWNHTFSDPRLFSNVSLIYTRFRYNITGEALDNSILIASSITDLGAKGDLSFRADERHNLRFGGSLVSHAFRPNIVQTTGDIATALESKKGIGIRNIEYGLYAEDEWRLSDRLQLLTGARLSGTSVDGHIYVNPEPRLAARYRLGEQHSIKVSYARMAQYMHLVSSSSLALPTDLWYPVTRAIRPGVSDQVSAGYYRSFKKLNATFSAEVYYKRLDHLIEYREGAQLILNDRYEQELVHGKGRSYGLELFASRTEGRLTGWIGYSLSFAHRTFDSLNGGREYFARYDRRHDVSVVAMYDMSKKWSVSSSVVWSTGSPFTGQVSQFMAPNPSFTGIEMLPVYTSRNALRLSSSFRIDLDLVRKFTIAGKVSGELHFSVYNLLNRTQPSRVVRTWDAAKQTYVYQQRGLFGAIPAIALNFKL